MLSPSFVIQIGRNSHRPSYFTESSYQPGLAHVGAAFYAHPFYFVARGLACTFLRIS